ncbi:dsDNA nuclease domain-containing protein [Bradyrhizobium sp. UFLA05-153]
MSFAERLISEPQREKSGETGYERFDYQALWGLALIFAHHGSSDDYAIAFEFHDDIVLLDSEQSPSRARFYQVKTKDKGTGRLPISTGAKQRRTTPLAESFLHGEAFFQLCHVSW